MDRLVARLREQSGTFTVGEVCELVRCSRSYIYKCIKAEAISAGKVGSDYRIPLQEARRLAREAGVIMD